MDLKSIGLNKKMKFSMSISNRNLLYSDYPDDAQDTLEPSHRLCALYSRHHILSPKSVDPNIFCATLDTLVEDDEKYAPLTSLPEDSHSLRANTQRACEHDPYLQLLLRFGHFHCYKFGSANRDNAPEYLPAKPDNDTSLPKQCGNSDCLQYERYDDIQTYCKGRKFIQTKVAAMKLQGFNP